MDEQVCEYLRYGTEPVTKNLITLARQGQIYPLSLASKEEWRASVREVLENLASYLEVRGEPDLLYPDAGLSPQLSQRIRELHGFSAPAGRADLIFVKYYRDAVMNYLSKLSFKREEQEKLNKMVLNYFDKFELSLGDALSQPIIVREVVEIERPGREMEDSQRRLYEILETIPAAAVVVDKTGNVMGLNSEASRLFGCSWADALRRSCREIVRSDLCDEDCALRKTFLSGGTFTRSATMAKRKGAGKIPLLTRGLCLKDHTGHVIGGLELFSSDKPGTPSDRVLDLADENLLKAIQKIERLAVTDEVTSLYTKEYFRDRADKEIKRAIRFRHPLSIILIEADHFELYQRLYGKEEASLLLKIIAGLLSFSIRSIDIAARTGVKQFGLILLECEKKNALEIANRICSGIREYRFAGREKLPLGKLTVSVGVSSYPGDGKAQQSLLNKAYENMCLAISRGGNQVVS